ncbi:MAG TPA: hypothetical protein VKA84_18620 [Gemmatimonadaceae bacterium]|nr:hypothetical protein [Gemmatimonadaceae bacterium]
MSGARTLSRFAAIAVAAAVIAGCSAESTTQPQPVANPDLIGGLIGTVGGTVGGVVGSVAPGLLACPTSNSYTATKVIGKSGGTIKVGPHTLTIPSGALSANTTITATAPAGQYVEVQFQPHGLRFAKATTLTLSYQQCGLVSGLLLDVAYVDDSYQILQLFGASNNILARTLTTKTDHFSSYAIAYRGETVVDVTEE